MSFYQTLLFISLAGQLSAQKVILYTNKHYAKWPLLENSYSFYVPNTPCSNVVFKSKHGRIGQNGCRIYYTPDTLVNTSFKVYKKVDRKLILIDSISIDVYEDMGLQAWISGKKGGTISRDEALRAEGLNVQFNVSEGHTEPISLISYRVITIRSDTSQTELNYGGRFNEKAITLISNLKANDKLIFVDIKIKDWLKREKYTSALEFTIQ
jgi:hypothetical protein